MVARAKPPRPARDSMTGFFVAGAGSWGTALAILLARNDHPVFLWDRSPQRRAVLANERANARYLPGIAFPPSLAIAEDLSQAATARHALVVVPSAGFRGMWRQLAPHLSPETGICWGTKGLEQDSLLLMHQVVAQEFGADRPAAMISGPTFAREIAQGLPAAITVASLDNPYAEQLAALLRGRKLRVYSSTDIIGVEIGAAAKNVIAISAGVSDGLGFGANARAALVTRGLNEIMRLGVSLGGKHETLMGLAGLGDLMLTCTDRQSRNYRFGFALGQGTPIDQALKQVGQVVEGYHTVRQIVALAQRCQLEMPISREVLAVVQGDCTPEEGVKRLLAREPKPEAMGFTPPCARPAS